MFATVPTNPMALEDYRGIVEERVLEEIRQLAEPLARSRVLHLTASAFGGVADMLGGLVPLLRDAGLPTDWQVIRTAPEFTQVVKEMYAGLQGDYVPWTPRHRETWLRYADLNAELFDGTYDFVIAHDPAVAGLLRAIESRRGRPPGRWLWFCHVDLSAVQLDVWDFLRHDVDRFDAAVFLTPDQVPFELPKPAVPHLASILPAIDPLHPRNMEIPRETVDRVVRQYNVDPDRPILLQISRFDRWKDPLGVVDAYRIVKQQEPAVQLVLVDAMVDEDAEERSFFERVSQRAGGDRDVHLLSTLDGVGNVEMNALQRACAVYLQKSFREGFGLFVTQALWKEKPVVAGNAGGLPVQVLYGKTGYLVNTVAECADRVLFLLRRPKIAARLGRTGRELVCDRFLITRYLWDMLRLLGEVRQAEPRK